jgi:enoyl-CoA hydratase
MAFTGRRIEAHRALRLGFVNEVYADREALLVGARTLAAEIAGNSPIVLEGVKAVLNFSEEHTIDEGLEFVAQWNAAFLHSHDLSEAVQAFLQKRPPAFKGE